jgi:hypothetical protein
VPFSGGAGLVLRRRSLLAATACLPPHPHTHSYAFDTVKVRLQTGSYSGMVHCFRHILKHEGVRRRRGTGGGQCLVHGRGRQSIVLSGCTLPAVVRSTTLGPARARARRRSSAVSRAAASPAARLLCAPQVRGLYQGLTPPLIGGAAETGVNYLVRR